MAMVLRNENELATLRCGLRFDSRHTFMATQPFLGAQALGSELLTPIEEMGFGSGASGHSLLNGTPGHLPDGVLQLVTALDAAAAPGTPLWLQVERDARIAAVFPWETQLAARFGRSVLRIPNYLKNPWTPRLRTRLAICASAPEAKGAPDLVTGLFRLLTALAQARRGQLPILEITLFTGADAYIELRDAAQEQRDTGLHITVLDPKEAADLVKPPRTTTLSGLPSQSPWLAWMARHYAVTGVDAVHFLCPGYSARDRSALALAESPLRNEDAAWARFVEVEELSTFYDRLGCAVMSFTALGAPVWAEAIHTLAYQLAWTRPGPILVDDERAGLDVLSALWRMLLVGEGLPPTPPLVLPCYLHPALTVTSDTVETLQAPDPTDDSVLSYGTAVIDRALPDGPLRWILNPPDGGRAQPKSLARAERARRDLIRPPDEALTDRILETQRARLSAATPRSSLEEARDRGTRVALDFLDEVLKR